MKKYATGGSQYSESDPRNPMNREGMIFRDMRKPPKNPPVPKKKPAPETQKGAKEVKGYKSGGGVGKALGQALGIISPLYGLMSGKGLGEFGTVGLAKKLIGDKNKPSSGDPVKDAAMRAAAGQPAVSAAPPPVGMRKGGAVKKAGGGSMKASKRGDGCAQRGKTRGRMV